MEKTLGSLSSAANANNKVEKAFSIDTKGKSGIDVVLGGQWGDEGKGKLVDILSQVSSVDFFSACIIMHEKCCFLYVCSMCVVSKIYPFHLQTYYYVL